MKRWNTAGPTSALAFWAAALLFCSACTSRDEQRGDRPNAPEATSSEDTPTDDPAAENSVSEEATAEVPDVEEVEIVSDSRNNARFRIEGLPERLAAKEASATLIGELSWPYFALRSFEESAAPCEAKHGYTRATDRHELLIAFPAEGSFVLCVTDETALQENLPRLETYASTIVHIDRTPPTGLSGLNVTILGGEATFSWPAASDYGPVTYHLAISSSGGDCKDPFYVTNMQETTYALPTFTKGGLFKACLGAVDDLGNDTGLQDFGVSFELPLNMRLLSVMVEQNGWRLSDSSGVLTRKRSDGSSIQAAFVSEDGAHGAIVTTESRFGAGILERATIFGKDRNTAVIEAQWDFPSAIGLSTVASLWHERRAYLLRHIRAAAGDIFELSKLDPENGESKTTSLSLPATDHLAIPVTLTRNENDPVIVAMSEVAVILWALTPEGEPIDVVRRPLSDCKRVIDVKVSRDGKRGVDSAALSHCLSHDERCLVHFLPGRRDFAPVLLQKLEGSSCSAALTLADLRAGFHDDYYALFGVERGSHDPDEAHSFQFMLERIHQGQSSEPVVIAPGQKPRSAKLSVDGAGAPIVSTVLQGGQIASYSAGAEGFQVLSSASCSDCRAHVILDAKALGKVLQ